MKKSGMERLSWTIQVSQPHHTGPYTWTTFPACGQRRRCDFGRKAQRDAVVLVLKMEEEGKGPRMLASTGGGKGEEQTLLKPSNSSTALLTPRLAQGDLQQAARVQNYESKSMFPKATVCGNLLQQKQEINAVE